MAGLYNRSFVHDSLKSSLKTNTFSTCMFFFSPLFNSFCYGLSCLQIYSFQRDKISHLLSISIITQFKRINVGILKKTVIHHPHHICEAPSQHPGIKEKLKPPIFFSHIQPIVDLHTDEAFNFFL